MYTSLLFICICTRFWTPKSGSAPSLWKWQAIILHVQGASAAAALRPAPGQRGHAQCPGDLSEADVQVCHGCCQQAGSTRRPVLSPSTTTQLTAWHPATLSSAPTGSNTQNPKRTGAPEFAAHTDHPSPRHGLHTLCAATPAAAALIASTPPWALKNQSTFAGPPCSCSNHPGGGTGQHSHRSPRSPQCSHGEASGPRGHAEGSPGGGCQRLRHVAAGDGPSHG